MSNRNQSSMFDGQRRSLVEALELTRMSLLSHALDYRHWAIAYSGGKDSSATVAAVLYLIESGQVPAPETLTVLYADTRQEIPPLHLGAMDVLADVARRGYRTQVVLPALDDRYFVYMLGRGVPPPNNNTLRWCTPQIKVEPMTNALAALRDRSPGLLLWSLRLDNWEGKLNEGYVWIRGDGSAIWREWQAYDLSFLVWSSQVVELPTSEAYAQCLADPDPRNRFDCLRQSLSGQDNLVCDEGWVADGI